MAASRGKATKRLQVTTRAAWRRWLERNHDTATEVWLVYQRKSTGKARVSYNDAVEEALCFGWIDSTQKRVDDERFAQRFTPRRRVGGLSEMNKQRARRLVAEGKMTPAGLAVLGDALEERPMKISPDVRRALKADPDAWRNFEAFPEGYRRIRVAYIEGARKRPEEFRRRLSNFVRMTAKNRRIGYVPEFR
ncbi:MAG TPA: YdeI/OmpD-associated family protein [Actinomycetota bacterium]|jgi:uncharacterized protein YdeI (YjbR/CyaY-like superfamily)